MVIGADATFLMSKKGVNDSYDVFFEEAAMLLNILEVTFSILLTSLMSKVNSVASC